MGVESILTLFRVQLHDAESSTKEQGAISANGEGRASGRFPSSAK